MTYIYELTEFYCEICSTWHRKGEDLFNKHIQLYNANYSFKVEKKEEK